MTGSLQAPRSCHCGMSVKVKRYCNLVKSQIFLDPKNARMLATRLFVTCMSRDYMIM